MKNIKNYTNTRKAKRDTPPVSLYGTWSVPVEISIASTQLKKQNAKG
jgi:hypothetical protein